ncbi:copper chaperone PCu(A)C [Meridianimarinicoccus sp. RP-17]|uniref:copper chaperone PCu(A)C n=1 Tax=Meridianimarinicoccus zhengii TaxID=2056810 RepID=UPI000DACF29B|nr:copper chaperone PCu(A)C [Phycocomes zhengii]
MKKLTIPLLATLTVLALTSGAALAGSEDVVVENAWARASIGVSRPGAAYMTIRNTGDEGVTLTGISTPIAMMPEIHETTTNAEGVSSMAPAGEITIAPGEAAELAPGGLHAMLMRLQEPMAKGDSFPLTLSFSDGGDVTVEVPILGIAARGPDG